MAQKSWMIDPNDPAVHRLIGRADALNITGDPDRAAHPLGSVTLADGRTVNAHVVHAVDAVITDGKSVVMINRLHEPGQGKPALPGGLIDPLKGGVENAILAGAREAMEETGIKITHGLRIGTRNMNRPHDIRIARGNGLEQKYGIKDSDIFMVSTQAVLYIVKDLENTNLQAGDDAIPGSARRVPIEHITRETVGIADHADLVRQAIEKYKFNKEFAKAAIIAAFGEAAQNRAEDFAVFRQYPSDRPQAQRLTTIIGNNENGDMKACDLTGNLTDGFQKSGKPEEARCANENEYRTWSNIFYLSDKAGQAMITDDEGAMGLMVELIQRPEPTLP